MSSPLSLGVSTGAASGKTSQSSLAGVLKLDPAKLAKAIGENPEGAKMMMQKWARSFNQTVDAVAAPGGTIEARINGDSEQVRELKTRITTMNEMLAVRQRALEADLRPVSKRSSRETAPRARG